MHVGAVARYLRGQGSVELAAQLRRLSSLRNAEAHSPDAETLVNEERKLVTAASEVDDMGATLEPAKVLDDTGRYTEPEEKFSDTLENSYKGLDLAGQVAELTARIDAMDVCLLAHTSRIEKVEKASAVFRLDGCLEAVRDEVFVRSLAFSARLDELENQATKASDNMSIVLEADLLHAVLFTFGSFFFGGCLCGEQGGYNWQNRV